MKEVLQFYWKDHIKSLGDYRERSMDPAKPSASSSPPRLKDMCMMPDPPDQSRYWVTPVDSMWGRIMHMSLSLGGGR